MKNLNLFILVFLNLIYITVFAQTSANSNVNITEVEAVVKKSQEKYDAAKKKIYRAEEKLLHMKRSGILSYNDLTEKEELLKKAKNKLAQMQLLLEHNTTLISQTKSNPSFRKSVRTTAANSNAKSQRRTLNDIQKEKIEQLREQQKQALLSKVKENRAKLKKQKAATD